MCENVQMHAYHSRFSDTYDLVVVAGSAGSHQPLILMLSRLPEDFPVPIVVVLHRARGLKSHLADILSRHTCLQVKEAAEAEPLRPGTVYVAPPDRHLLIGSDRRLVLSDSPPVNYSRPAADPLLLSAVRCFGPRVIGVVLSGGGEDGAAGVRQIRQAGGVGLIQSPETCQIFGMPHAALRRKGVDLAVAPERLAAALVSLVMVPGAAAQFGLLSRELLCDTAA